MKEIIFQEPIWLIGTNIPLIKIKGNLIKLESIIMLEGLSVGGEEIKSPKDEKQKAASIVPKIKLKFIIPHPSKITLTKKMKKVIKSPNRKEATMSPSIIAQSAIGEETNLSKVFIRVSQGAITGPMEETVTKSAIPNKLGIKKSKESSFPKTKAANKKDGIKIPDIITGPFK